VLFTSRFADRTFTDATGTEVILTGAALPLTATASFTATVAEVRPSLGDSLIAPDRIVLSGNGTPSAFLAALTPGEAVEISLSITAGWETVTHAVGGGQYVVEDGEIDVDPHDPGFADVTHPRTAIGIKADGDVVMATVDGRQPAEK